jgi:hypothetical protein
VDFGIGVLGFMVRGVGYRFRCSRVRVRGSVRAC